MAAPPPPALRAGPVTTVGYLALLGYVFMYLSRVLDLTAPYLKLPLMLNLVFAGVAVVSGGVRRFFQSRIGLLVVAFYCWVLVTIPFSVWKGGSVELLVRFTRSVILMLGIVALVVTTRHCLYLMYTLGLAATAGAGVGLLFGVQSLTERLVLTTGTFADPNFYCMTLFLGLPFLWLHARNATLPWSKAFHLLCSLVVIGAAGSTGSRMGPLILGVMSAVLFLRATPGRKLFIVAVSGFLLAVSTVVFSDYILARWTSFFEVEPSEELTELQMRYLEGATVASAENRLHILRRSLELTYKHPLFGVGPGMFAVGEHEDARAKGLRKGLWHATHNSYTEVSSETGLPGFVLYVTILIVGFRRISRLRRMLKPVDSPDWKPVRYAVTYLEASYIGLLTAAMFLSFAYQGLIFLLLGLIVALERSVDRELQLRPPAPAPARMPALSQR